MLRHRSHLVLLLLAMITTVSFCPSRVLAVTLEEEKEIGRKVNLQVLEAYKVSDDEQAQKEINEIGQRLAKGVSRPQISYTFKVLKGDELNAFAVPAGYIYFTERLWNVLRPDERIGVLGHEIVHVDRRHSIDAMLNSQRTRTWTQVLLILINANDTLATAADIGNTLHELKYSRGDEKQADQYGTELIKNAGYNPAGLLMALRKIMRFESEAGGSPPAIFASHPPTKERLANLTRMLSEMGVPVPPENVGSLQNGNRIGQITQVNKNSTVSLDLTSPVQDGQVLWAMREGWDPRYENKTQVAFARIFALGEGSNRTYYYTLLPGEAANQLKAGAAVYAPPAPQVSNSVGILEMSFPPIKSGGIKAKEKLERLERLMFRAVVWDKLKNAPAAESTAQVVITGPTNTPVGFLSGPRPDFAYANHTTGQLVRFTDPHQNRWVGAVASIGKDSGQVEVAPEKKLTLGTIYLVLEPAWRSSDTMETRKIATAKATSVEGRIILDIKDYALGHDIKDIQTAYDVYEQ